MLMIYVIPSVVATVVYLGLYAVLFENADSFKKSLRDTIYFFPLSVLLDSVLNWSPSFKQVSLRAL